MAEHKTSDVLTLTLLAGLAGAGLALLLAPRSGRETREQLQQSADELKHKAGDNFDRTKAKLHHNAEKLKAWKEHLANRASEQSQQIQDKIQAAADSSPEEISDFNASVLRNWEEEV